MYRAITRGIQVTVRPEYLRDRSDPEANHYVFSYTVEILNLGTETVRLLTRHWEIADGSGHVHVVDGAGVVGETPELQPGEHFEYTSSVPLRAPSGVMAGHYGMISMPGEHFDIEVPAFSLDAEGVGRVLN